MSLLSSLKSKLHHKHATRAQQKQAHAQEKQRQQDAKRQKDPNGLLKMALKSGVRRLSFTAADPGRFYTAHPTEDAHNDPWREKGAEEGRAYEAT
jgi:hypothetical protein